MKAIINGKLYSTETAECVVPHSPSTFGLYCTAKGQWFVCAPSVQLVDARRAMSIVGREAPDRYEEFFGEAEEG